MRPGLRAPLLVLGMVVLGVGLAFLLAWNAGPFDGGAEGRGSAGPPGDWAVAVLVAAVPIAMWLARRR